ncbi:syntaxin-17-like [Anneissia japonica]|uniref:syntaxin-17-like n=1 Tax=Anneissia japonica TaxID=1529436 RepID=UPI001425BB6C|nr:syntaxin-17-like [Anneissia japonica]XP_033110184.1 syntaxin-17-like [Anneissia japonica]XP_033110185.1 syntaxin-17-like [Anneissia japonica]
MASFENRRPVSSNSGCVQKQSLKRVEHSVVKFTKVIVPADLDRLNQHKVNIDKYRQQLEWDKLNNEQINASRTVQQLKSNIKEMQKLRNQICEADVEEFDMRVQPTQIQAIEAVINFMGENEEVESIFGESSHDDLGIFGQADSSTKLAAGSQENLGDYENSVAETGFTTQTQEEEEGSRASKESWRHLQQGLIELNSIIQDFALLIKGQKEPVSSIEDHIDSAQANVQKGTMHLLKATRLKTALFPVTGAVVGGLVGGPIGLYAGMKIGLLATGGGVIVGYAGGRVLKTSINKSNDIPLVEMSEKQALSASDLD